MSGFPCPSCRADIPPGASSCPECGRPPVVCERFRLERALGSGGMGTVYAARDERDGTEVAAKLVTLKDGVDWKVFELFERGTEVLRRLRHPCLPRLYAFEKTAAGALALVRERFDGGSLEQRVIERRRSYAPDELRRMLETLLELLVYLHGRSPPVLHRDIKASNIMFRTDADEGPVLVDFDTVAAPGDQTRRTTLVVSPGYTAPEQYAGDVSPASDLYSLGATMLLAATGTHPDELPRRDGRFLVGDRLRSLPDELRAAVLKLVEPDKRNRFANAEEALAALRRRPVPAAEPAASRRQERARKDDERRRRKAMARASSAAGGRTAPDPRRHAKAALWGVGSLALGIPSLLIDGTWIASVAAMASAMGAMIVFMRWRGERKDDSHDVLFGTGVTCAVLAGWMAASILYWNGVHEEQAAEDARSAPGVLESVQLAPGGDRIVLVGHRTSETEDSTRDTYRIDLIDPVSGRRLVRRVFGEKEPWCMPTESGPLWCEADGRPLMALDQATLETVADWADLQRRNPGLTGEPQGWPDVDRASGAALLAMPDGRSWRVDPRQFEARPVEEPEYGVLRDSLAAIRREPDTELGAATFDGAYHAFAAPEGSQRARMTRENVPISTDDFLQPSFVEDPAAADQPLRVPGSGALLVLHRTSLDYQSATDLLSAVALDGQTLWTAPTRLKELELGAVAGGTIVLVGDTAAGPGLVLGLDPATGAEKWRLDT